MIFFEMFLLGCLNIISPPEPKIRYPTRRAKRYPTIEDMTTESFYLTGAIFALQDTVEVKTNEFYLGETAFARDRENTRVNEEYDEGNPDW